VETAVVHHPEDTVPHLGDLERDTVLLLTMRKLLRFILLRMVFSIWETLRNILSSSFSLSSRASRVEADPCIRLEVRTIKKQAL
jgi:hypothetical protein